MKERKRLIYRCYEQLEPSGIMVFTAISKKSNMYGNGKRLSKNRYKTMKELNVFFYDSNSAVNEFNYGFENAHEFCEPVKFKKNEPPLHFIFIMCIKK